MPIYVYKDSLSDAEREFVEVQLKRLASLSFQELCAIPESLGISVPEDLAPFTAHIIREPIREGLVRVIVQGFRKNKKFFFIQFAAVEAGGFSKDQLGTFKELEPQDLYGYT
ncbi:MAG: hypothetical protein IPN65_07300 [Elusimicrobia bacterium]|jgi:hypothetical protein|nr:hypothetical protein [Elusimicrobiota bacterium]MBK7208734.1 hypothetical protein [Elusimicrobiota bacterium]MBK7544423.1 hypothetical protein [Elusimicrobiota bacterium]MBK7573945.1 hypothetical protein [Elusimicrobiota bacterium]MBK7689543.1 hypothetical protein [Elusimicrobiota bacterium]